MYPYSICPYHFLLATRSLQTPSALSLVPDDRLAQKRFDWLISSTAGLHLLVMSYSVLERKLNEAVEIARDVELWEK